MKARWLSMWMLLLPWAHSAAQEPVPISGIDVVNKVLLVNLIEPELTHSHIAYTMLGTYENKISNDWGLDRRLNELVRKSLEDEGHVVQEFQLTDELTKEVLKSGFLTPGGRGVRSQVIPLLAAQIEQAGAGTMVVLRTYATPLPLMIVNNSGYGLLTMHGQKTGFAFLYANVAAEVIRGKPSVVAPRPKPKKSECKLHFKPSEIHVDSFEAIQAADLAPYRSAIETLAEQRLLQDLILAGLVKGEFRACKAGPLRPGERL